MGAAAAAETADRAVETLAFFFWAAALYRFGIVRCAPRHHLRDAAWKFADCREDDRVETTPPEKQGAKQSVWHSDWGLCVDCVEDSHPYDLLQRSPRHDAAVTCARLSTVPRLQPAHVLFSPLRAFEQALTVFSQSDRHIDTGLSVAQSGGQSTAMVARIARVIESHRGKTK